MSAARNLEKNNEKTNPHKHALEEDPASAIRQARTRFHRENTPMWFPVVNHVNEVTSLWRFVDVRLVDT